MWLVLHMENKIRNPSESRSWETLIFRHRICGLYYTWRTKSGIRVRVDSCILFNYVITAHAYMGGLVVGATTD